MAKVEAKTRFQINGTIDMWLTSLNWPIYRGSKHVPVVVYQPGEMYDVLAALKYDEFGHTLDVTCNGPGGQPRNLRIHGVFVIDVQKIHDGEDGVRVTFADRRYLLNHRVIDESWGLLFQGKYLADTAENDVTSFKLADAIDRFILPDFPFQGFTREDWREPFDKTNLDMRIPNDVLSAGKAFGPALDTLLDFWGFDLSVDTEGRFYFADRLETEAGSEQETSASIGSGGMKWIADHTEEMEWILREPDFSGAATRSQALTPGKFKVKFWEEHSLQVPFPDISPPDERATASQFVAASVIEQAIRQHGLNLVQVYEALGGFYSYKNLLAAYGKDERDIGQDPRRFFNRPNLFGTKLAFGNIVISDTEREIRFTLQEAIRASERSFYAITPEGGGGTNAAWTNMRLGELNGSGNIEPQKVVGDWTEIVRKAPGFIFPQLPRKIVALPRRGPLPDPIAWLSEQFIEWRNNANEIKEAMRIAGKQMPLAIIHTHNRKFIGSDVPTVLEELAEDDPFEQPLFPVEERFMDEAAALGVKWKAAPAAIVELTTDQRRIKGRTDAIIGTPTQIPFVVLENIRGIDPKNAFFKAFVLRNQLKMAGQVEDMEWDLAYSFWIHVVARRNAPNSEDKFWIETVEGPPGASGPDMELECDPATPARRAAVDYIRNLTVETFEFKRPNGADGYGKILNRNEIEEEAARRVRNKIAEMTAPAAFSHEFMNIEILPQRTLMGALDSFMLKLAGSVVSVEMNAQVRGQEGARRSDATRRSRQAEAEVHGKLVGR